MSNFTFSASASCDRCGVLLSSSDEDCNECVDMEERRYHFVRITDDKIETVWAISPLRGWAKLTERVDDVIPYKLYETDYMSVHYMQMGYDVRDPDELREN